MQFAIVCLDKPDRGSLRAETRPAHLDHLNAHLDQIVLAGPLLSEDGERPLGSLLVMEFHDIAAARTFAEADPYARAGLFERVDIRPFRKVLP